MNSEMATSKKSDAEAPESAKTELDEPQWAVISFDRCEVSGVTYAEAAQKVTELEERNVPGLCIVTNEAAERIVSA